MGYQELVNLSQIASNWSQVIGAAGVIISLVYLAKQVGDNTKAIRASTYQSVTENTTLITFEIASSEDLARFVQRVGLSDALPEDVTDILRWEAYAYTVFRNLDNVYFQYLSGTLSKERMENLTKMALSFNFKSYPRMREYWLRTRSGFDDSFRHYVDTALKEVIDFQNSANT